MDDKFLNQAVDEVTNDAKKERDYVLKNNFASAASVNPDQEAEARRLSAATELPLETTRNKPELVKQHAADADLDKIAMNDEAPLTADFFTNPNNVRVAKDDIQSLMQLEYQFTPEAEAQEREHGSIRAYHGPEPSIPSALRSIGAAVTGGFGLAEAGLGTMLSDYMGWDLAAESSIKDAERIRAKQDMLRPNYLSNTAGAVHQGFESFAMNAPGIAASVATANPVPALALAGGLTQTEAYTRYRARGATPSQAFVASMGEGGVEVATELLPMNFLVGKLGKKGMQEVLQQRLGDTLTSGAGYALREIPGEQVATFLQDAIDTAVANPDKTWDDFVNERPNAAYQTLVATLTGTTAFGGVRAGARYATKGLREEEEKRVAEIAQAALRSNLRQRDPNLFKSFIDKVTEQAPNLSDFYVSPNALAQSGIDIDGLQELSPELLNELRVAQNTGRDARIPVSEFSAHLVDTPSGEALLDHLKLGPHTMSKVEAEQYMQEQGAELQAEVEKALAKREGDSAFQTSKQNVENQITEMLDSVGRFTTDVNRANATLAANFYAVQANRLGITPEEMFKKYPVKVQANLGQGFSFADYAQTDDTAFKKWFSTSKVVDTDGAPLRVYHGTDQDVTSFDTNSQRTPVQTRVGTFFSSNPAIAGTYAPTNRGGSVYPTYLSLKNPLEVDAEGAVWRSISPDAKMLDGRTLREAFGAEDFTTTDELTRAARVHGYDGVIIRNVVDRGSRSGLFDGTPSDQAADVFVAFEPNQIKSVHNTQPTEGPDILNQSGVTEETLKRDEMGFYSQLAREVIHMNLPNWKPNKKKALTQEQLDEIAEFEKNPVMSTKDERYPRSEELVQLQREAAGLASGKEIWAKVKGLPVKNEELEWLGIEEFLMSRDKHTRQEVVDFIQDNGVDIQEVVADEDANDAEMHFSDVGIWDDPEAWDWRVDDIMSELEEDTDFEDRATDDILETERDYIAKHFEDRDDLEIEADGSTSEVEVIEWVQQEFADEIANKAENARREQAEEQAENEYRDNPMRIYKAETEETDYYIFGNDEAGYSVRVHDWENSSNTVANDIWSLGEAEIQAEQEARERDHLVNEDDPNVAKWSEYTMSGPSDNYRELKLTLPEVEGDFYNDVHFPDRNVLAFLRVDDRDLPRAGEFLAQAKALDPNAVNEFDVNGEGRTIADYTAEKAKLTEEVRALLPETEKAMRRLADIVYPAAEDQQRKEASIESRLKLFQGDLDMLDDPKASFNDVDSVHAAKELTQRAEERARMEERQFSEEEQALVDTLNNFAFMIGEAVQRQSVITKAKQIYTKQTTDSLVANSSTANTYFVDEFQSDWHQQGREEGYQLSGAEEDKLAEAESFAEQNLKNFEMEQAAPYASLFEEKGRLAKFFELDSAGEWYSLADREGFYSELKDIFGVALDVQTIYTRNTAGQLSSIARSISQLNAPREWGVLKDKLDEAHSEHTKASEGIANAPFKNDAWINLGVKRAILNAVEQGYDQVAWVGSKTVSNRWSDRYATAYQNQYDKKMVSAFKKLTKQQPVHIDHGYNEDYWVIEITDELRQRVKNEGFPLFQDKNSVKRGAFNPDDNTITLLRDADLSTFLHEFGHFALEVQTDLAAKASAPDQIKADMDALLKWFGVEGATRGKRLSKWRSMSLEEKREMHEKMARGFERYLMEGKAPSAELRQFFQRFRDWLVSIYRQLKNLNVDLKPEVRQVFDRMLATDDAIAEAEEIARYEPLFKDAQQAGMTTEEFREYQSTGAQATANAKETLDKRNMRDMQWLSNARSAGIKKMQKKAESKRREVRAEVTAEVEAEPVYRAMEYLKRGTIDGEKAGEGFNKLSITELKAIYGKDTPLYKSMVEKFKYGQYGMLGDENGVHPDQIAELFGFTSGDHLVKTLLDAEPKKDKIDGLVDRRMLERYGDLTDPESIEQAVMESLRNDTRAKFVAAEVAALNKALGGRKFLAEAAKQFSETMVARQRIRDLRPYQYEVAEAKAAREAEKAFAKADLDVAAGHKRNQLINLYAAKGARNAVEEVEKGLKYFKRFDRKRKKGKPNLDAAYLDQIEQLLERYDLKRTTNKAVDKRVSLREWVAKQEEQGLEPDIPAALLDDARKRSYKELTVQEFRGLKDSIRQIEHLGRMKNKLLTAKKQRQFDAAKAEILEAIEANAPAKVPDLRTRTNAGGTLKEMGGNFLAMHRKMANLLQQMDGYEDAGPLWEYIVRGMNDAGDRETSMREESTIKLAKITERLLSEERMGGKGEFFPSVNMSLNREERIAMALNLGNEGNTQRLLDGEGWTIQQLQPVLDTLTKDDWDFVQDVWDYFESYRPAIAEKERRVYGREPEWVEPKPVQTKFGTYRGGYYPIKYDAKRSGASQQFQEAEDAKAMMQNAFTASTTRRSFTKSRAEEVTGRPLLYSFQGIYQGTEEIIHDLTHHEWLIDVNKFLRDNEIDKAFRKFYGADAADLIKRAVRDVATGMQPAQNVWERGLNHIRMGATVAGLGWNFSTSLLQPLGLTNSMARIGPGWVSKGLVSWFKSPTDAVEEIYAKSEFMRLRAKTMQREINEIQNRLQQPGPVQSTVGKVVGVQNAQKTKEFMEWSMFLTIQKMQLVADVPTWLGQYEKSIAEGKDEETAARLADQAVIDAQGGGQVKDLSEIQRGSSMQKLWTNFYSYFNVVYNLNADIKNRTDWKDPYQVAVAARDYMLVMVAPAILGYLMKEAITGGDDDDWSAEKLAKALAAEQMSYLFGTMVGLRETAAVAQRIAGINQYNGSYSGPAGLRLFQELDKLGTQVSQGKLDRALRKSVINTSGILFHLPAAQINRTLDGVVAVAEGDAGPIAIIGGAR